MESPQSVVSPVPESVVFHESEKQNEVISSENIPKEIDFRKNITAVDESEECLGALEVFIHQARDIHNICIYQKQDVYAKLCLTSDPEITVSTKIINGGGRNPIFNENVNLNVRTVDSSLKCEIWMLSRVRNYLEDQLLGFALVPVSEILIHNGKLEKDFSLSSTDLFHSPAGFVQMTVLYVGVQPEVIPIIVPHASIDIETTETDCDLDSIEFPDPRVVNENNKMVEEYFALDSHIIPEIPTLTGAKTSPRKGDSPSSSASTNGTASISNPFSLATSETSNIHDEAHVSPTNESSKKTNGLDVAESSDDTFQKPKVVQQEIVDLYMKSMQQFTDSLAKMKLPMDFENSSTSTESSTGSEQKTPASKNSGSRVFYGSRAFF